MTLGPSEARRTLGQAASWRRLVMLFYRLGRRLRGQRSVADGAALAITVE